MCVCTIYGIEKKYVLPRSVYCRLLETSRTRRPVKIKKYWIPPERLISYTCGGRSLALRSHPQLPGQSATSPSLTPHMGKCACYLNNLARSPFARTLVKARRPEVGTRNSARRLDDDPRAPNNPSAVQYASVIGETVLEHGHRHLTRHRPGGC